MAITVTLVERDPDKVGELSDLLDARIVEGDGTTTPVLREAGIESAGLVVAATERDECNLVAGFLASHVFGTPHVVVRVRDPLHEDGFQKACAEQPSEGVCVNPDTASVDRIAALLEVPGAVDVMQFFGGGMLVAGFRISASSDFAGLRGLRHESSFREYPHSGCGGFSEGGIGSCPVEPKPSRPEISCTSPLLAANYTMCSPWWERLPNATVASWWTGPLPSVWLWPNVLKRVMSGLSCWRMTEAWRIAPPVNSTTSW